MEMQISCKSHVTLTELSFRSSVAHLNIFLTSSFLQADKSRHPSHSESQAEAWFVSTRQLLQLPISILVELHLGMKSHSVKTADLEKSVTVVFNCCSKLY